jgi:hypothetical protein
MMRFPIVTGGFLLFLAVAIEPRAFLLARHKKSKPSSNMWVR